MFFLQENLHLFFVVESNFVNAFLRFCSEFALIITYFNITNGSSFYTVFFIWAAIVLEFENDSAMN